MSAKLFLNPLLSACFGLGILVASPVTNAELIGTAQLVQSEAAQDRTTVDRFVSRAEVQKKLQDLGLSAIVTAQRVALLSDAEARELSQKIDALPAGGNFSNNELIIILLAVVLLVLVL